MFLARCDDFENHMMKEEKECYKDLNDITDKFDKILEKLPKKINESVSDDFEMIYYKIMKFSTDWNKRYYRFGIKDGIKLMDEIKTDYRKRKNDEENFIIDYESDFNDFFENYKVKVLYKNEEYFKIIKSISDLLDKYPRIRKLYEDNKIDKFSDDEIKAILEFIDLNESKNSIEVRTAFALGMTQRDIV